MIATAVVNGLIVEKLVISLRGFSCIFGRVACVSEGWLGWRISLWLRESYAWGM